MTLREWIRLILRRWYVAGAVLLLTAGVVVALQHDRPKVRSQVTVVFLSPTAPGGNSYSAYRADVPVLAGVAIKSILAEGNTAVLDQGGALAPYSVDLTNAGTTATPDFSRPTAVVAAESTDAGLARETVDRVAQALIEETDSLQRQYSPEAEYYVQAARLSDASTFTVLGRPSRALAMTLIIGVLWSIGLCALVDSIAQRRWLRTAPSDWIRG